MKYKKVTDCLRQEDSKRNQKAIVTEYQKRQITRDEYWQYVNKYCNYFESIGVKKGDVVTICMKNAPEYDFMYMALLEIGAVCSTVSLSFFKSDISFHTTKKGAEVIALSSEYSSEELKEAFKQMKDLDKIKKIIFTCGAAYSSNESNYDYGKTEKSINDLNLPKSVKTVYPEELRSRIASMPSYLVKPNNENLLDQSAVYSNTGGTTTGIPKCTVHTHRAIISLFEAHRKEVLPDFPLEEGDKSLLLIPISHITSQFYSLLLRRFAGANIVFEDAFNPNVFVKTIEEEKINDVVSPFGLYIPLALMAKEGRYKHLKNPSSGGEPTPFGPTKFVNESLIKAGSVPIYIGTGSTEFGSGVMGSYGVHDRINESGVLFPGVKAIIFNPYTGKEAKIGEKGVLYLNSPWQMDRYLNNEKATKKFFSYTDEDGVVYGTQGDVTSITREHNGKPLYSMHGRNNEFMLPTINQFYISGYTKEEQVKADFSEGVFLFDLKEQTLNTPGVLEAEITPLNNEKSDEKRLVANIVLMPHQQPDEVLKRIYEEKNILTAQLSGIKFLTNFERNPATDKRDILSIRNEKEGYYIIENGQIKVINFDAICNIATKETTMSDKVNIVKPPEAKQIKILK